MARSAAERPEDDKSEAQLRRLDREEQRLVDAYQAEAIDLAELKDRRTQIAGRRQVLVARRDQEAQFRADRQAARRVYDDLTVFCARLRSRLAEATVQEQQRALQLLIERVIVGADTLEVRHVIPLRPGAPGPDCPDGPEGGTGGPKDGEKVDGRTAPTACHRLRSLGVPAARSSVNRVQGLPAGGGR